MLKFLLSYQWSPTNILNNCNSTTSFHIFMNHPVGDKVKLLYMAHGHLWITCVTKYFHTKKQAFLLTINKLCRPPLQKTPRLLPLRTTLYVCDFHNFIPSLINHNKNLETSNQLHRKGYTCSTFLILTLVNLNWWICQEIKNNICLKVSEVSMKPNKYVIAQPLSIVRAARQSSEGATINLPWVESKKMTFLYEIGQWNSLLNYEIYFF